MSLFKHPDVGTKLNKFGIDLNGPQNGVWLPVDNFVGRTASLHRSNHLGRRLGANGALKESYAQEITRRFRSVNTREKALELIDEIRNELLTTKGLLYREPGL